MDTLKVISKYCDQVNSSVQELEATYDSISEIRENFPLMFLSKSEIKPFLSQLETKINKEINKIKEENNKVKEEIKKKSALFKKVNDDSKREIKKELRKLKMKLDTNLIRQKELSTLLKGSDEVERVRYFYEDLLILVSNCKHKALDLLKYSIGLFESISIEVDHFAAKLYLDDSEVFLRSKGFTKITLKEREAFLNSREEYKDLLLLKSKMKALRDSARKLLDAFESDEINYRKFAERRQLIE